MVLCARGPDPKTAREDVAVAYLRGEGIEIGALDHPLRIPRGARVRYVDYLDLDDLDEAHRTPWRPAGLSWCPMSWTTGPTWPPFPSGLWTLSSPTTCSSTSRTRLRPSGITCGFSDRTASST